MSPEWVDQKIAEYVPIASNVTLDNPECRGLRVGDVVRINGISHGKIVTFGDGMITYRSAKDDHVASCSTDNVIDLIY